MMSLKVLTWLEASPQQADELNDVEVFVTDRSGLSSLTTGSSFTPIYASGRVTSGNIDVVLSPGNYYLVFSNVFSLISAKAISTEIELRQ
jgi:hypothetical protein